MPLDTLDIFILNYNGWHLINENLPSVLSDMKGYNGVVELYIVDNASTDGSVLKIKSNYPGVKIIANENNDYLFAYNKAIINSNAKFIMLLNNDIKLKGGNLNNLTEYFSNIKNLFSAQQLLYTWEGNAVNAGRRVCYVNPEKGFFEFGTDKNITEPAYTLSASGGASVYDREKFIKLGGFDKLFAPAYFEDSDITWRAWANGWPSIFVPNAIGYHKNQASWNSTMQQSEIHELMKSNQLIFMWRHMTGFKFWSKHIILLLPRIILWDFKEARLTWTKAFFRALLRAPLVIKSRAEDITHKDAKSIIEKASGAVNIIR